MRMQKLRNLLQFGTTLKQFADGGKICFRKQVSGDHIGPAQNAFLIIIQMERQLVAGGNAVGDDLCARLR